MPYSSVSELPPGIRNSLPPNAARMWMHVFNSSLKQLGSEDCARKAAWGAVKKRYSKNADGTWVKKSEAKAIAEARENNLVNRVFCEAISLANVRVDRDKRMIYGGAAHGPRSVNKADKPKYDWHKTAHLEAAERLPGTRVYFNHDLNGRFDNVDDLAGMVKSAYYDEAAALTRTDIKARVGKRGDQMLADAEANPEMVGFSMNHESRWNPEEQRVYHVDRIYRLDFVAEPASTRSMFESKSKHEEVSEMQWSDITAEALKENAPEVYEAVLDTGIQKGQESKDKDSKIAELESKYQEAATELATVKQAEAKREREAMVDAILLEHKVEKEAIEEIRPVLLAMESREQIETVVKRIAAAQKSDETKSQETPAKSDSASGDVKAAWNAQRR